MSIPERWDVGLGLYLCTGDVKVWFCVPALVPTWLLDFSPKENSVVRIQISSPDKACAHKVKVVIRLLRVYTLSGINRCGLPLAVIKARQLPSRRKCNCLDGRTAGNTLHFPSCIADRSIGELDDNARIPDTIAILKSGLWIGVVLATIAMVIGYSGKTSTFTTLWGRKSIGSTATSLPLIYIANQLSA